MKDRKSLIWKRNNVIKSINGMYKKKNSKNHSLDESRPYRNGSTFVSYITHSCTNWSVCKLE